MRQEITKAAESSRRGECGSLWRRVWLSPGTVTGREHSGQDVACNSVMLQQIFHPFSWYCICLATTEFPSDMV